MVGGQAVTLVGRDQKKSCRNSPTFIRLGPADFHREALHIFNERPDCCRAVPQRVASEAIAAGNGFQRQIVSIEGLLEDIQPRR